MFGADVDDMNDLLQLCGSILKAHVLLAGDTRFYTCYISASRLVACHDVMEQVLVCDEVLAWGNKAANRAKMIELKQLVRDEEMWSRLRLFCTMLKPFVRLTRLVDSNMPTMGLVSSCKIACLTQAGANVCPCAYMHANCRRSQGHPLHPFKLGLHTNFAANLLCLLAGSLYALSGNVL